MTPLLIVPPYYLNGIDTTSKDAVQKKKDCFYHIVRDTAETLKISIIWTYTVIDGASLRT